MSRAYAANGLNQYTQTGTIAPTYDALANLTSAGPDSYAYNTENLLVAASNGATFGYDPLGRMHRIAGGSAGTTVLHYDGDALVAEYDAAGNVLRRYAHGPGVDEPLVWYEGPSVFDMRWLHADHQGSLIGVSTLQGSPQAINTYDEYGIPASANLGRFQYTGQAWLPELGMYHYKARIYSPTLGRFLQTDPIGYEGGQNLYAYVGNDPVNLVDPSGTSGKLLRVLSNIGRHGVRGGIRETARETRNAWNALRTDSGATTGQKISAAAELVTGIPLYSSNENPYENPASDPIIVVDGRGNAIPVGQGERITSSPDGDYQQVRGPDGRPTGVRIDRGGHKNQNDPAAQGPHAHRPGITRGDGNPHLPVREEDEPK